MRISSLDIPAGIITTSIPLHIGRRCEKTVTTSIRGRNAVDEAVATDS